MPHLWHVSPLADCFFSRRTPERTAHPLRPSCRAMSTRIQTFSERLLPCFLARPPASQSVLHCCTLQVRLTPSSGLICCTYPTAAAQFLRQTPPTEFRELSRYCSLCQTIWTRGLPTRDSSSITGLVLDKSFPYSLYYHGVILKRPRDRQHGDINPDPPATAQLQHAITWKPYGWVPFFGYSVYIPVPVFPWQQYRTRCTGLGAH